MSVAFRAKLVFFSDGDCCMSTGVGIAHQLKEIVETYSCYISFHMYVHSSDSEKRLALKIDNTL